MIFKRNRLLLLAAVTVFCMLLGAVSVGGQAYADSPSPTDYILSPNPLSQQYFNAVNGCTYTIPISKALASAIESKLVRIEYTVVEYSDPVGTDVVTVDEKGDITSEHKILTWDDVKQEHIAAVIETPATQSLHHWKQFKVTVYEWCAVIFYVYYKPSAGDEEQLSLDSEILICTAIDHGKPTAYYNNYTFVEGKYNFNVVIRSNKLSEKKSADSGLKRFEVYKKINGVRQKAIDYVTNIGNTFYNYTLIADTGKGAYYVLAEDNAGNQSETLVVHFSGTSYDAGFESAIENALTELSGKKNYHESVHNKLASAYYDYFLIVQSADATKTQIEDAMENTRVYLREYNALKEMEKNGIKDWTLSVLNKEYLSGQASVLNFERAYASLMYGEKATLSLSLAEFDPDRVNKSAVIKRAGVTGVKSILAVTVTLNNNKSGYLEEKFSVPMQVKIPIGRVGSVKAVLEQEGENGTVYTVLDIDHYAEYIVVYLPASYGTVNLLLGGTNLLWLLFLLVIPVGAGVATVLIVLKKRKRAENEKGKEPQEEGEQTGESVEKPPSNKSKKGKHKKKQQRN